MIKKNILTDADAAKTREFLKKEMKRQIVTTSILVATVVAAGIAVYSMKDYSGE